MANSKHIINKQELKITLNSHKDAHVIQEAILRAYKSNVIPVLDRLFDKYALPESNIKIDKLTIDIGSLTLKALDTDFPDKVEKHIEEELIKYCNKPGNNQLITNYSIYDKEQPGSAEKSIKSKEELWIEALEIFMYTGSMPWWINRDSSTTIESIVAHLIESYPAATKRLFAKQLKNSIARKRIIYQTSDALLEKLILLMAPEFSKDILIILKSLFLTHSERAIINLSETIFRKSVFNSVLIEILKTENNSTYTKSNKAQLLYSIVHALACESGISKPTAKEIVSILNFVLGNIKESRNKSVKESTGILEYYIKQIIKQEQNTALHNEKPLKIKAGDKSKHLDPETGISLKNESIESAGDEKDEAEIRASINKERKPGIKNDQNIEFDTLKKEDNRNKDVSEREKNVQKKKESSIEEKSKNELLAEQTKFDKPKNVIDNSEIEKAKLYQRSNELISEKEEDFNSFENKYSKEDQIEETKKNRQINDHHKIDKLKKDEEQDDNKVQKENKPSIKDNTHKEFSGEQTIIGKPKKAGDKSVNEKTKSYKGGNELIPGKENDISSTFEDTRNKEINKDKQIDDHHEFDKLNKEEAQWESVVQKGEESTIKNSVNKEFSEEQTKFDIPEKANDRSGIEEIKTFQKSKDLISKKEKDINSFFENKNSEENQKKEINLSSDQEFEKTLFAEPFIPIPKIEEEYISNAGLIIVWPFLSSFFKALSLVEKDNFISDEAKFKAIHILQYLVTGKEKTQENELLLNKLLCGLDVSEPVPVEIKLSKKEKKECDILLLDIIENWSALKRTSVESLQVTFLQKNGLIKKHTGGWKLLIERTTVDILIDRLPWSISVIKLPWSKELLFVEW